LNIRVSMIIPRRTSYPDLDTLGGETVTSCANAPLVHYGGPANYCAEAVRDPLDDAILASLVCVCPGSPRAKEGELHPPCSTGLRRGVLPSSWPSHRRTKGLYSGVYSTFSVPAVRLSASGQRLTSKTCYQHTPGPLAHGICLQGSECTRIAVNSVRGETA